MQLKYPEIEWREGTPHQSAVGSHLSCAYFHREQNEHVYLWLNDIAHRAKRSSKQFSVGEFGFGTGLNFFLTWKAWREFGTGHLTYFSFERAPLDVDDIRKALQRSPDLSPLIEEFIAQAPLRLAGWHSLKFDEGRVSLILAYDSLETVLTELVGRMDAWYLDGFSPISNPELWNEAAAEFLTRHSHIGTTCSARFAESPLTNSLESRGWRVTREPIPNSGDLALRGQFNGPIASKSNTPWFALGNSSPGNRVAVIGGGVAGMTTASALAARGFDVTLVERVQPFQQASGNRAAVVSPYFSADADRRQQFLLRSFEFSHRYYRNAARSVSNLWDPAGVVFSPDQSRIEQLRTIVTQLPTSLATQLNGALSADVLGVPWSRESLYFPTGGVVFPEQLRAYFEGSAAFVVKSGTCVTSLARADQGWNLRLESGSILEADAVILCSGPESASFLQTSHLPLLPIWGETFNLSAVETSNALRCPLVASSYITPAYGGVHTVGATNIRHEAQASRVEAHRAKLIDSLHEFDSFLPSGDTSAALSPAHLSARAAAYDRFPYLGPVPDIQKFCNVFWDLRKGFDPGVYGPAPLHSGLFINTGHGSRGFVSAPYCAEILAAIINDEPLPIERSLLNHLLPARYPVRELRKPWSDALKPYFADR